MAKKLYTGGLVRQSKGVTLTITRHQESQAVLTQRPAPFQEDAGNQLPGVLICRIPKPLPMGDWLLRWALKPNCQNTAGLQTPPILHLQPETECSSTDGGLAPAISQLNYFVALISTALSHPLHALGKVNKSSGCTVTHLSKYGTIKHNPSFQGGLWLKALIRTLTGCFICSTP